MIALPKAISQGSNAAGGGALTAFVYKSAEKAEPAVIASTAAAKTIFFMSIPIAFNTVPFRRPPGTSGNRLQPNSVTCSQSGTRHPSSESKKDKHLPPFWALSPSRKMLSACVALQQQLRVIFVPVRRLLGNRPASGRKNQGPADRDPIESAA